MPLAHGEDFQSSGAWFGQKRLLKICIMSPNLLMIYTHVLNRGGMGVRSPADGLAWPPEPGSEIS